MYFLKTGLSRITPANLNGSRQNFTGICRPNSNLTCLNYDARSEPTGPKMAAKSGCFVRGTMNLFFFVTGQIGTKVGHKTSIGVFY